MKIYLYSFIFIVAPFFVQANALLTYDSEYMGLEVGKSSMTDVLEILGKPGDRFESKGYTKLIYRDGIFVINSNSYKINSIVITNPDYVDFNGFSLGSSYDQVKLLPNIREGEGWIFDVNNGVVYWFESNLVHKIVYLHQAKK